MSRPHSTALFLAGHLALAAVVGGVLAGPPGALLAMVAVVVLAVSGARVASRMILRLRGAVRLGPRTAPRLFSRVRWLARRANIPTPALYLTRTADANAVSLDLGGGQGAVMVTDGLLRLLDPDEVEGVLAHEVAHLAHRDSSLLAVTALLGRGVVLALEVAIWLALVVAFLTGAGGLVLLKLIGVAFVTPLALAALQQGLSRSREYEADRRAAQLTGRPWALASALQRLGARHSGLLARAGGSDDTPTWLRSHPPTSERIRRLMRGPDRALGPQASAARWMTSLQG